MKWRSKYWFSSRRRPLEIEETPPEIATVMLAFLRLVTFRCGTRVVSIKKFTWDIIRAEKTWVRFPPDASSLGLSPSQVSDYFPRRWKRDDVRSEEWCYNRGVQIFSEVRAVRSPLFHPRHDLWDFWENARITIPTCGGYPKWICKRGCRNPYYCG